MGRRKKSVLESVFNLIFKTPKAKGRGFAKRPNPRRNVWDKMAQCADATIAECKAWGDDLVMVSNHHNSCPACAELENRVFSISGKDKEYEKLPEWPPHPGCRHNLLPTSRGIISLDGVSASPEGKNGKLTSGYYEAIKIRRMRDSRVGLARDYEKVGNIEGAIILYEENLSEVDRSDSDSVERLAILYRKMGRYDDEIRALEIALPVIQSEKLRERLTRAKALKEKRERRSK
jgi:tetratricopeptide (TPR) repeat protein